MDAPLLLLNILYQPPRPRSIGAGRVARPRRDWAVARLSSLAYLLFRVLIATRLAPLLFAAPAAELLDHTP
jgi:hypothetical protein